VSLQVDQRRRVINRHSHFLPSAGGGLVDLALWRVSRSRIRVCHGVYASSKACVERDLLPRDVIDDISAQREETSDADRQIVLRTVQSDRPSRATMLAGNRP
jgi:hypothetical protein